MFIKGTALLSLFVSMLMIGTSVRWIFTNSLPNRETFSVLTRAGGHPDWNLRNVFKPIPIDPCFLEEVLFDVTWNRFRITFRLLRLFLIIDLVFQKEDFLVLGVGVHGRKAFESSLTNSS